MAFDAFKVNLIIILVSTLVSYGLCAAIPLPNQAQADFVNFQGQNTFPDQRERQILAAVNKIIDAKVSQSNTLPSNPNDRLIPMRGDMQFPIPNSPQDWIPGSSNLTHATSDMTPTLSPESSSPSIPRDTASPVTLSIPSTESSSSGSWGSRPSSTFYPRVTTDTTFSFTTFDPEAISESEHSEEVFTFAPTTQLSPTGVPSTQPVKTEIPNIIEPAPNMGNTAGSTETSTISPVTTPTETIVPPGMLDLTTSSTNVPVSSTESTKDSEENTQENKGSTTASSATPSSFNTPDDSGENTNIAPGDFIPLDPTTVTSTMKSETTSADNSAENRSHPSTEETPVVTGSSSGTNEGLAVDESAENKDAPAANSDDSDKQDYSEESIEKDSDDKSEESSANSSDVSKDSNSSENSDDTSKSSNDDISESSESSTDESDSTNDSDDVSKTYDDDSSISKSLENSEETSKSPEESDDKSESSENSDDQSDSSENNNDESDSSDDNGDSSESSNDVGNNSKSSEDESKSSENSDDSSESSNSSSSDSQSSEDSNEKSDKSNEHSSESKSTEDSSHQFKSLEESYSDFDSAVDDSNNSEKDSDENSSIESSESNEVERERSDDSGEIKDKYTEEASNVAGDGNKTKNFLVPQQPASSDGDEYGDGDSYGDNDDDDDNSKEKSNEDNSSEESAEKTESELLDDFFESMFESDRWENSIFADKDDLFGDLFEDNDLFKSSQMGVDNAAFLFENNVNGIATTITPPKQLNNGAFIEMSGRLLTDIDETVNNLFFNLESWLDQHRIHPAHPGSYQIQAVNELEHLNGFINGVFQSFDRQFLHDKKK